MTKPAASTEPHFRPGVWQLCHKARLWRMERRDDKDTEKRNAKTETLQACSSFLCTCCAQNNDLVVPLRSYVVRNSQRGPSALTELTGIRSMITDFKDTQPKRSPTYIPLFVSCQVSNKPLFLLLYLSNGGSRNETSQFFSLKCVNFLGLEIKNIYIYVKQQDILITDTLSSVHIIQNLLSYHTTENRHWMRWVLDPTAAFISFTVMAVS